VISDGRSEVDLLSILRIHTKVDAVDHTRTKITINKKNHPGKKKKKEGEKRRKKKLKYN